MPGGMIGIIGQVSATQDVGIAADTSGGMKVGASAKDLADYGGLPISDRSQAGVGYGAYLLPVQGGTAGTGDSTNPAQCVGALGDSVGWTYMRFRFTGADLSSKSACAVVGYSTGNGDTANVKTRVDNILNKNTGVGGTPDGSVTAGVAIMRLDEVLELFADASVTTTIKTVYVALSLPVTDAGFGLAVNGSKPS